MNLNEIWKCFGKASNPEIRAKEIQQLHKQVKKYIIKHNSKC